MKLTDILEYQYKEASTYQDRTQSLGKLRENSVNDLRKSGSSKKHPKKTRRGSMVAKHGLNQQ